ncbi:hypothetical protein N9M16_09655 [Candidatus Dependentiae bacterium]|nr:hypothetical protein [Candidatus Dependentiae bacterium]
MSSHGRGSSRWASSESSERCAKQGPIIGFFSFVPAWARFSRRGGACSTLAATDWDRDIRVRPPRHRHRVGGQPLGRSNSPEFRPRDRSGTVPGASRFRAIARLALENHSGTERTRFFTPRTPPETASWGDVALATPREYGESSRTTRGGHLRRVYRPSRASRLRRLPPNFT